MMLSFTSKSDASGITVDSARSSVEKLKPSVKKVAWHRPFIKRLFMSIDLFTFVHIKWVFVLRLDNTTKGTKGVSITINF
jgi:hypothetical protein